MSTFHVKLFRSVHVARVLLELSELQERRRQFAGQRGRRGRREGVPQRLRVVERGAPLVIVFAAARGVHRGGHGSRRQVSRFQYYSNLRLQ